MTDIARIVRNLTRYIPEPAKPKPKSVKTWRRLKPGQYLRNKHRWRLLEPVEPGRLWTVLEVDSQGAKLGLLFEDCSLQELTANTEVGIQRTIRWENPEWETSFERARKPRSSSTKKSS